MIGRLVFTEQRGFKRQYSRRESTAGCSFDMINHLIFLLVELFHFIVIWNRSAGDRSQLSTLKRPPS